MRVDGAPTIELLLAEQRQLTAVERFADWHESAAGAAPAQSRYYRDLIPLTQPRPGQQYAFDVDLDACSGCKACVSACHRLNGLEWGETWRNVGLLLGQNGSPHMQHVTTACHHCLDPGCLAGCPTNAYEKDPATGVVRHLDDQCFGCQYCTMMCPYEVPQYSESKGIVRKCDMCHGRLAAGEAPACVQACPNQAIRIAIVDEVDVRARATAGDFLPGTPPPHYTAPTTIYRGAGRLPLDARPADESVVRPQHAHLPLVVLLVLTQAATGGFVAATIGLAGVGAAEALLKALSLLLGVIGLGAATLHLGRPQYAFRGMLGWRHSWMSREAIAFGVFLPLAAGSAAEAASRWFGVRLAPPSVGALATASAAAAALAGVFCSIRIYQATQREFWRGSRTAAKFWLTTAALGLALALVCETAAGDGRQGASGPRTVVALSLAIVVATVAKMIYEHAIFKSNGAIATTLAASAVLFFRTPQSLAWARYACALLGGVILTPSVALIALAGGTPLSLAVVASALLLAGELLERMLYFRAVVPLKMPGGIAA